jgi:hypothetical protein
MKISLLIKRAFGEDCLLPWKESDDCLLVQNPKPQLIDHKDIAFLDTLLQSLEVLERPVTVLVSTLWDRIKAMVTLNNSNAGFPMLK